MSVTLNDAFTQVSQDAVTGNLVFGNQLTPSIGEIKLSGGSGAADGPASNNFGHIVTWEPTQERFFYMNFMAADLLLYEWHTIVATYGSVVYPSCLPYLDRSNRHTWIYLQRNVRNTNDYFVLNNNTATFKGDGGQYDPWGICVGSRPPVIIHYYQTGWIGGDFGGIKTALGFDIVFRYDQGDFVNVYNRFLILYPGASFTGSQWVRESTDYQTNNINAQWPHRDANFSSGHESAAHDNSYNSGTYPP